MLKEKKGSSSMAQKGKGTAKQCMVKRTGKHSQRGSERKRHQENIQDSKRSVARYWDRESEYT